MSESNAHQTKAPPGKPSQEVGEEGSDRRAILAGAVGAAVVLAPVAVGAAVFFDPLRDKPEARQRPDSIEVCSLDEIPENGTPVLRNVRADMWDQWTFSPNDLLGSVFLRRDSADDGPMCFNSICPHAGCRVSFNGAKEAAEQLYRCPCHNSAFNMDGSTHGRTPSPRGMDELKCEVRDGKVWVEFKNYYSGKPEKVEKK